MNHDLREYDANGHYVHGPRLAPQPISLMIAETVSPPGALTPAVARAQMRERRRRAKRSLSARERVLAAIRGEKIGRNRKVA